MVLVQKRPFFQLFFWHYRQKKVVYDIQERENPFRGYKNNKFKKTKNGHFSTIFFLGNIGQENVFYDILQRKSNFLGYKNKNFKKSKN